MLMSLMAAAVADEEGCCFVEFAKDPEFLAMHPLKVLENWTPTKGKMIEFETTSGAKAKAFWAAPAKDSKSVVIMVHDFWGMTDNLKQTAEKLNEASGYGVLAVDMYKGQVAKDTTEARKHMQGVTRTYGESVVAGAVKALKTGPLFKADKIGTIGYCFGGGWSHTTAILGGQDVDACVIYYGQPDIKDESLTKLKAPVLMIWPTKDRWINKQMVDGFKAAMKKHKKSLQVEAYDADHAFANPTNARYNQKAGDDAWAKTLAFYKKHL
jgi:carboxymethylenebutenolidase